MNPEFGSNIWNFVYDPFTADVKQAIVDDVTSVANHDPRTQVTNLQVVEFEHGIQIEIDMIFVETNQADNLVLQFNRDSNNIAIV